MIQNTILARGILERMPYLGDPAGSCQRAKGSSWNWLEGMVFFYQEPEGKEGILLLLTGKMVFQFKLPVQQAF